MRAFISLHSTAYNLSSQITENCTYEKGVLKSSSLSIWCNFTVLCEVCVKEKLLAMCTWTESKFSTFKNYTPLRIPTRNCITSYNEFIIMNYYEFSTFLCTYNVCSTLLYCPIVSSLNVKYRIACQRFVILFKLHL